jgi:thiamine biosynthesis lipoprotein
MEAFPTAKATEYVASQRTTLSRVSSSHQCPAPPDDAFRRDRGDGGQRSRRCGRGQRGSGPLRQHVLHQRHAHGGDTGDVRDLDDIEVIVDRFGQGQYHHERADHDHHRPDGHVRRHRTMITSKAGAATEKLLVRTWPAIGTHATVVVQRPDHADAAEMILRAEIDVFDRACSRFRGDSELQVVHAQAGRPVPVSEALFEALAVACTVAHRTAGAVDPTIGNAIERLGYDRDLSEVERQPGSALLDLDPAIGYMHVQLDRGRRTVRIPRGVKLDLGSSAKALIADRAAARIAGAVGTGALVSIGGDVAVAGEPPPEGWAVGIAVSSSQPAGEADQAVAIRRGGLASSSPSVRRWTVGDREVHHIVDPMTGDCVSPYWTVVSATGASCVEANAVTTAALVWGHQALRRLPSFDQAVRLVRHDGRIFSLNGWPEERAA